MARIPIADDPARSLRHVLRRLSVRLRPDHLPGEDPCRILVGGDLDERELRAAVGAILGAPAGDALLRHEGFVLRLGANDHAGTGDAGRWPLAIETSPEETVPHRRYVALLETLLGGLGERGLRAVALCAFADDLTSQGARSRRHMRQV